MAINVTRIEKGIEVCGWDGARFGTVSRIWVDDPGTIVSSGYFEVVLDSAEEHQLQELHVPFSAVADCIPGDSIRLDFSYRPESTCYRALPRLQEW